MGNKKEHKIENDIEMKHCPTCDKWKALSEYNKQSSSWDKLARMCRNCYCEYKNSKRKNDEKYKQSDILYKQKYEQSGRRKEVSKIRYEIKKDEILKKNIAYNKKNIIQTLILK